MAQSQTRVAALATIIIALVALTLAAIGAGNSPASNNLPTSEQQANGYCVANAAICADQLDH